VFSHKVTCIMMISCRNRQGLIPHKKIRNNLLAAVLALTVIPSTIKVGQVVLEQFCITTSQQLLGMGEVRTTLHV
jgi:HEAT repeat-containing protein 5